MPAGIQGGFNLKYIIASTPRSSTGYLSQLFTSAGVPIGHEMFYGMPGNGFYPKNAVGDSSWLAVPHLRSEQLKDATVIHLVRNPLKTVSSMFHAQNLEDRNLGTNIYCMYKLKCLPDILKYKGLDRYLFFWTVWHKEIDLRTDKLYRIESINKNPKKIFADLGIDISKKKLYTKKYNAYKDVSYLKLKDLKGCNPILVKEFKELTKKYGYKLT